MLSSSDAFESFHQVYADRIVTQQMLQESLNDHFFYYSVAERSQVLYAGYATPVD